MVSGDSAQHLAGQLLGDLVRNIAQAEHAYHANLAVGHGEASNFFLSIALIATAISSSGRIASDVFRHHISSGQLTHVFAIRHCSTSDVAVGHHANQPELRRRHRRASVLRFPSAKRLARRTSPVCITSLTFMLISLGR